MARRHGVGYLAGDGSEGAKAGNINGASLTSDAPFVAVLDCDHVPTPTSWRCACRLRARADVAFVQTPQYCTRT